MHAFIGVNEMMRSGHGDDLRAVLLLVCLPDECITILCAPHPRGLTALDIEVQMRPAAAGALLADEPDALAHLHAFARDHGSGNHQEMAVPVVPAAIVADVDDVVTRCNRQILLIVEYALGRGNDQSIRGRNDLHHALRAAEVQAVVIIDALLGRYVTAVDIAGDIGHLGVGGEPLLLDRVDECAGANPG